MNTSSEVTSPEVNVPREPIVNADDQIPTNRNSSAGIKLGLAGGLIGLAAITFSPSGSFRQQDNQASLTGQDSHAIPLTVILDRKGRLLFSRHPGQEENLSRLVNEALSLE